MRPPLLSLHVTTAAALLMPLAASAAPPPPTDNPFMGPIPQGQFAAHVRDYATVPFTDGSPRLNLMLPDPTGRLFVNDQRGTLYSVPGLGSTGQEYLDVKDLGVGFLGGTGEQGFQSFAFHPNFAAADPSTPGYGKLYLAFSANRTSGTPDFTPTSGDSHDSVLLELTAANPLAPTFTGTKREVLRVQQPFSNHNMGLVAFNPTAAPGSADYGNLYIAFGDGGSGNDPQNNAQNLANPFGSILRIDPLGNNSANAKYGNPADNPFADDGDTSTLAETFAYGLRNPQRFSWDAQGPGATGEMFISDIGQGVIEEIDLGQKGGNYGWKVREGSFVNDQNNKVSALPADDADNNFLYPIAEYDHNGDIPNASVANRAVVVGYVPRGPGLGDLAGKLIFSDFPSGVLFYIDADNLPAMKAGRAPIHELLLTEDGITNERLIDLIRDQINNPGQGRADTRFGYGANGEVFILNKVDGVIRQIIPEPATASLLALAIAPLLLRRRRH